MSQPHKYRTRQGRPVRPNLKDEAAAYLRDQILAGKLRPGDRIDQDLVADELGISRLPVREAIITLSTEGLIDTLPRRGAFVAELTANDVLDHYVIFGVISGLAAERAATTLGDAQLDTLDDLARQIDASTDPREQEDLNFRMHQTINRAGASRRLLAVLAMLQNNMPTRFFEFTEDWNTHAARDHKEILQALRARDGRRAAEAVAAHFRTAGEHAVHTLRTSGFWDQH